MKLYYSRPLSVLCDSDGYPLQTTPELAYGDIQVVELTVLDENNEAVDLSAASSWKLSIDVDRNAETAAICSIQDIVYDSTTKSLHYRLDSKTAEYFLAVNGKSHLVLIAELCGYDSTNTRLYRFPWNMIGIMPVDGGEGPDSEHSASSDYSAFEVYANSEEIATGTDHEILGHVTVAIPAQMTEIFQIRSNYKHEDSDIIIDWGDDSESVVHNGDIQSEDLSEWNREHQYEAKYFLSHTYAETGKYTIRIFGKRYFCITHQWSGGNNLMCRCLDKELPLASHINNLAGFGMNATRLVELCIPTAMSLVNIENYYMAFSGCVNLLYANGFKRKLKSVRTIDHLFYQCAALINTDLVLPVTCIDLASGQNCVFMNCSSLTTPIQNLLPSTGFANRILYVQHLFYNCASLTGTVPAALLWEDTSIVWQGTSQVFTGASEAIRAQVPTSWGGTQS
jgi:hypothetical protein